MYLDVKFFEVHSRVAIDLISSIFNNKYRYDQIRLE